MAEKWTKTSSPLWRWMNPKPLLALNHFTVPCSLFTAFTRFCQPVTAEHYFKLSDAPSPAPLVRATAVFKLCPVDRKAMCRTKKGRKCDLATAFLPKGDTRATNAETY